MPVIEWVIPPMAGLYRYVVTERPPTGGRIEVPVNCFAVLSIETPSMFKDSSTATQCLRRHPLNAAKQRLNTKRSEVLECRQADVSRCPLLTSNFLKMIDLKPRL
jgi:hypothetical protein